MCSHAFMTAAKQPLGGSADSALHCLPPTPTPHHNTGAWPVPQLSGLLGWTTRDNLLLCELWQKFHKLFQSEKKTPTCRPPTRQHALMRELKMNGVSEFAKTLLGTSTYEVLVHLLLLLLCTPWPQGRRVGSHQVYIHTYIQSLSLDGL